MPGISLEEGRWRFSVLPKPLLYFPFSLNLSASHRKNLEGLVLCGPSPPIPIGSTAALQRRTEFRVAVRVSLCV